MSRECPDCGLRYMTESAEDRGYHRRFHNRWAKPRFPKPDATIAALSREAGGDIIVDHTSPRWLHKRVYEIACALQRDQRFDFPQWSEGGETALQDQTHAILFIEGEGVVIGATAFSFLVPWQDHPPGWHMAFVWIAPPWRRQGQLAKRWPGFRARYGEFTLEHPLSEPMRAFADKAGVPYFRNHWMHQGGGHDARES